MNFSKNWKKNKKNVKKLNQRFQNLKEKWQKKQHIAEMISLFQMPKSMNGRKRSSKKENNFKSFVWIF